MSSRFVFLALFPVVHEVLLFHRDLFTFSLFYSAHLRMQCFVILSQFLESHTIHFCCVLIFIRHFGQHLVTWVLCAHCKAFIRIWKWYLHLHGRLHLAHHGKYQPLCTRSCCTVAEIAKLKSKNVSVWI